MRNQIRMAAQDCDSGRAAGVEGWINLVEHSRPDRFAERRRHVGPPLKLQLRSVTQESVRKT
jgi:hypothetical protein